MPNSEDRDLLVPPAPPENTPEPEQTWTVWTLVYNKQALLILFGWLLFNDFCLVLMGEVQRFIPILFKDHGATDANIGLWIGTFGGMLNVIVNPFVSTWSDGFRSSWGRRRPFLLVAAPVVTLFLCLIPLMPHIAHAVGIHSTAGVVASIGMAFLGFTIAQSVVAAIFSYYFWDVVPEAVLGRFFSLMRIVSAAGQFLFSYFLFGLGTDYMTPLMIGIALFYGVVYVVSICMVKEGEYPPPPPKVKKNEPIWEPIVQYFKVCFGLPYYRWIFFSFVIAQTANFSNMYQIFYFRDGLNLDLDTIGKMGAWPQLLIVLIAYPAGVLLDRYNPFYTVTPTFLTLALTNVWAFFYLKGPYTYMATLILLGISNLIHGIGSSILNVRIYPKERIGQFCSAAQISCSLTSILLAWPIGRMFDWVRQHHFTFLWFDYVHQHRYTFLWSALFQTIAAILFVKLYYNWKAVDGVPPNPTPGAGGDGGSGEGGLGSSILDHEGNAPGSLAITPAEEEIHEGIIQLETHKRELDLGHAEG